MSGALAIGATSVMVLCIVLGLFLDGAVTLLLFGVAATLATYLVLISGSFVVVAARRRQPPGRGGLTGSWLPAPSESIAVGVVC